MNTVEEVAGQGHDFVEVGFERPVPAVVRSPGDQRRRPVLAQTGLAGGEPGEVGLQPLHQADRDLAMLGVGGVSHRVCVAGHALASRGG